MVTLFSTIYNSRIEFRKFCKYGIVEDKVVPRRASKEFLTCRLSSCLLKNLIHYFVIVYADLKLKAGF